MASLIFREKFFSWSINSMIVFPTMFSQLVFINFPVIYGSIIFLLPGVPYSFRFTNIINWAIFTLNFIKKCCFDSLGILSLCFETFYNSVVRVKCALNVLIWQYTYVVYSSNIYHTYIFSLILFPYGILAYWTLSLSLAEAGFPIFLLTLLTDSL